MALTVESSLVLCDSDQLKPFVSHPDHLIILAKPGQNVSLREPSNFPKPFEGKYDLRIVESLLIQSQ
jgi:hypothetical protein